MLLWFRFSICKHWSLLSVLLLHFFRTLLSVSHILKVEEGTFAKIKKIQWRTINWYQHQLASGRNVCKVRRLLACSLEHETAAASASLCVRLAGIVVKGRTLGGPLPSPMTQQKHRKRDLSEPRISYAADAVFLLRQ